MRKKTLHEIAKIVDNEYYGKFKSFIADKRKGYYLLTTNVCDCASLIRVFVTKKSEVVKIDRIGPDTPDDGSWQTIQPTTMARVEEYLVNCEREECNDKASFVLFRGDFEWRLCSECVKLPIFSKCKVREVLI